MKGGRFSVCWPAVGSSNCQLRDGNKQLERRDLQTGKGRHTKAEDVTRKDVKVSVLAQTHQPFMGKSSVLQRGNNSVSVLCSCERIRNCFTTEGKAPRMIQEACAGEVRSAASYPAALSPLWVDRVARSVTKCKWCVWLSELAGRGF